MWLALVIAGGSPLSVWASADEILPTHFKAIGGLEEIVPGKCYLIGAEYEVRAEGKLNKGFCLLSRLPLGSNLSGITSEYPLVQSLEEKDGRCVWRCSRKENGLVVLFSPQTKEGIAGGKSASQLKMASSDWIDWALEEEGDSVFILRKASDAAKALGLNWMPDSQRFGCYSTGGANSVRLRFYKEVSSIDMSGTAEKPRNGESVAMLSDGKVALCNHSSTVTLADAKGYLLQDGSLAVGDRACQWTCQWTADDAFELTDGEQRGIEWVIPGIPVHQQWKIDNGYVVTADAPIRYLVTVGEDRIALLPKEELEVEQNEPVLFLPVAAPADSVCNASGVKVLSGGWNAQQLAKVSWEGVHALDMSEISLPVAARDFVNLPDRQNRLLYVAEKGIKYCADSWKNIVVCREDGARYLMADMHLQDGASWSLDREINTSGVLVSYQRNAHKDGGWETLYLPFDAEVPTHFCVEQLVDYSEEDRVLTFEPTSHITAHVPVIFRYTGVVREDELVFEVASTSNVLLPEPVASDLFKGTFTPLVVDDSMTDAFYFLDAEGRNFVKAASLSGLAPFRSYIWEEGRMNHWTVRHSDLSTGVTPVEMGIGVACGSPCYDVVGHLHSPSLTWQQWKELPSGVYIVNGRKYLK